MKIAAVLVVVAALCTVGLFALGIVVLPGTERELADVKREFFALSEVPGTRKIRHQFTKKITAVSLFSQYERAGSPDDFFNAFEPEIRRNGWRPLTLNMIPAHQCRDGIDQMRQYQKSGLFLILVAPLVDADGGKNENYLMIKNE